MNANASIKLLVAFLAIAVIVTLFWMLDWDQKYKDIETHEATIERRRRSCRNSASWSPSCPPSPLARWN